jgi:hypothetical protein
MCIGFNNRHIISGNLLIKEEGTENITIIKGTKCAEYCQEE